MQEYLHYISLNTGKERGTMTIHIDDLSEFGNFGHSAILVKILFLTKWRLTYNRKHTHAHTYRKRCHFLIVIKLYVTQSQNLYFSKRSKSTRKKFLQKTHEETKIITKILNYRLAQISLAVYLKGINILFLHYEGRYIYLLRSFK